MTTPLEETMRTSALTEQDFEVAAPQWLESLRGRRAETTIKSYAERIRVMCGYWGKKRLPKITPENIREYQDLRQPKAGASCINHEISILQQMMKRCALWDEIGPAYEPLPLPKKSKHRRLTPEEEEILHRVGPSNPNWDVAYCCTVLTINTTCGFGELRFLRRMDIDSIERTIHVQIEGCKNEYRERVIPLIPTAWRAMQYLLDRADRLGATAPYNYLLPFQTKRNTFDPNRPMTSCRSAFREMMKACGLDISYYCLRHHGITKLLEQPITDQMVQAIAGHVSKKMLERYSHIRIQEKRKVLMKLEKIAPQSVKISTKKKDQAS